MSDEASSSGFDAKRNLPGQRDRIQSMVQYVDRSREEWRLATEEEEDEEEEEKQGGQGEDRQPEDSRLATPVKLKMAGETVAPFLAKHIPDQYAPMGNQLNGPRLPDGGSSTKYCYRHHPDLKCQRQADEPSMDQLQKGLESLSQADQQAIAHVWALFSAAPAKHRNLMLQGIVTQCCFPQLSFLSASVRELIRIDFLTALPPEISFQILCYLDTASLCRAAQVSHRWRALADDDVVWHRMCEQHIDRKCHRCGWGLPLLERNRLRASKRQIQLRATGRGLDQSALEMPSDPEKAKIKRTEDSIDAAIATAQTDLTWTPDRKRASSGDGAESPAKRMCAGLRETDTDAALNPSRARPWKEVYKDRFKVGTNWKHGRCSTKIFRGHTNGVMCLQFDDAILATGSYDATIKIWDIETGQELRTLRGHECGIRALQFDETKLISGSLDQTLKCWNWRTGECMSTYTGHVGGVICLHFDGSLLASGSMDKTIKIWNFEDKSTFLLRGHKDWVNAVRVNVSSRTLFSASDDCTVRLWDLDAKTTVRVFEGHVGQVQQVVTLPHDFDFDEQEMTTTDEASRSPSAPWVEEGASDATGSDDVDRRREPVYAAAGLPLPRYILTGALDSTVRLWKVATGQCVRTFFGHVEGVWALAADTLRIVSGAEDRMVKVWDPSSGKCERTFTGHSGPVTCIGLSDSRMCTGSEDWDVRLCSFRTGA
ncbi:MAG: hypothetical protein M1826_005663 [Phylliscum demangeonii]|nr:MAG: hypothetical protein M1826_005663 [Phylliscum demangeonii]